MVNTGTWNSDFAVFLFLLMMAPIFIAGLVQVLTAISSVNQGPINITTEVKQEPSKQITFEDIKKAALDKAAQGDKSARDWVTKHVFCPVEESIKSQKSFKTKDHIINDAISAMVAVKFKKDEAKRKVLTLVSQKQYKDASELFRDAIKRG